MNVLLLITLKSSKLQKRKKSLIILLPSITTINIFGKNEDFMIKYVAIIVFIALIVTAIAKP